MDNFDNIATLKKRLKSKYYSREDINYFKFLIEIEKKKIPPTEIIFQLGLIHWSIQFKQISQFL